MTRLCKPLFAAHLQPIPCVAIIGPRQCGKITLTGSLTNDWRRFDWSGPTAAVSWYVILIRSCGSCETRHRDDRLPRVGTGDAVTSATNAIGEANVAWAIESWKTRWATASAPPIPGPLPTKALPERSSNDQSSLCPSLGRVGLSGWRIVRAARVTCVLTTMLTGAILIEVGGGLSQADGWHE